MYTRSTLFLDLNALHLYITFYVQYHEHLYCPFEVLTKVKKYLSHFFYVQTNIGLVATAQKH